jgi:hypothetical protein
MQPFTPPTRLCQTRSCAGRTDGTSGCTQSVALISRGRVFCVRAESRLKCAENILRYSSHCRVAADLRLYKRGLLHTRSIHCRWIAASISTTWSAGIAPTIGCVATTVKTAST